MDMNDIYARLVHVSDHRGGVNVRENCQEEQPAIVDGISVGNPPGTP